MRFSFHKTLRNSTWVVMCFLAMGLLSSSGCSKEEAPPPPAPTAMDATATLNGVEVSILGIESLVPDLLDSNGHAALITSGSDRIFVVRLQFKNTEKAEINYTPRHNAATGQPDTTPLLFVMPEKPEDKMTPIQNVRLADNFFTPRQVMSPTKIAPAAILTDEYLFSVPPKDAKELLLSIPATIFGGSAGDNAKFALPNEPKRIEATPFVGLNTPITHGAIKLQVTAINDEYVEAVKVSGKAEDQEMKYPYAYTVEPILKVAVEFTNTGKEDLIYAPGHRDNESVGVKMDIVSGKELTLRRFKLADAKAVAKEQLKGPMTLKAGETYKDVFLFQRPPVGGSGKVTLVFSGHIFGVRGLYGFELPYKSYEPTPPDLEPYKKEVPAAPAPAP